MSKRRTCYVWRVDICTGTPDPSLGAPINGGSKHWCPPCQRARIAHLNGAFADISKSFEERSP